MTGFDNFTAVAFRQGEAAQANQLIDEVRRELQAELGVAAINYEVVLTGRPADYLWSEVGPRLAFFLRSKRYRVSHCPAVFLSVFVGDDLYFIRAADFFRELRLSRGLAEDTFAALARGWEQSGQQALAALPPSDDGSNGRGSADGSPGGGGE